MFASTTTCNEVEDGVDQRSVCTFCAVSLILIDTVWVNIQGLNLFPHSDSF